MDGNNMRLDGDREEVAFEPSVVELEDSLAMKGERERRREWTLGPLSAFWLG